MNGCCKPVLLFLSRMSSRPECQRVPILHFREMDDDVISSGRYVNVCRPDSGQVSLKGNKVNISTIVEGLPSLPEVSCDLGLKKEGLSGQCRPTNSNETQSMKSPPRLGGLSIQSMLRCFGSESVKIKGEIEIIFADLAVHHRGEFQAKSNIQKKREYIMSRLLNTSNTQQHYLTLQEHLVAHV